LISWMPPSPQPNRFSGLTCTPARTLVKQIKIYVSIVGLV
jgi:hypothetical protein